MNVLINGLGNIGQTLTALILHYKSQLNIDNIHVLKNTPKPYEDYSFWTKKGVQIHFDRKQVPQKSIHYIFDCTQGGVSHIQKKWYETFDNLLGAAAQGTEHDFGYPLMFGINEQEASEHKYHHIVSCNTHGILSVLKFVSPLLSNIETADFVIVRRSEDLSNHLRLVTANVVARHRESAIGTHHATDAKALLNKIGIDFPIFSSDITTPSQLMHTLRFRIATTQKCKTKHGYTAETKQFDSNKIFEFGRRNGFQGRIYNHSIIVTNNIIENANQTIGWAFIPQEGNTILSTISAYAVRCIGYESREIIKSIYDDVNIF